MQIGFVRSYQHDFVDYIYYFLGTFGYQMFDRYPPASTFPIWANTSGMFWTLCQL